MLKNVLYLPKISIIYVVIQVKNVTKLKITRKITKWHPLTYKPTP